MRAIAQVGEAVATELESSEMLAKWLQSTKSAA